MIARVFHGIASRLRAAVFRARGMRIEGNCWLRAIEAPRNHRAIKLEQNVALDRGVVLLVVGEPNESNEKFSIVIGRRTYINRHTIIDASELVEIGADCMIGPFCYITDHDHTADETGRPGGGALVSAPTRIAPRCWLGAHVTVLKGVTIGAGTVVGAGSVVTKSLPPRVVAVGNPARVIRELAPDETLSKSV
jgi:acetyltransferase-like isoleucine patch superfamily enzyme